MDWIRGHSIGRGASSATVSIAKARGSNIVFAVKSMELSKSQVLQREHAILSCLSCPQVVGYVGCDVSNENGEFVYNLCMEYVAGGTLSDLIRNRGGRLDEATIGSYARDILLGLDYIHKCGLVHCDIKGGNILIGAEGAKIADLGCAKWVEEGRELVIAGTPVFMAPEVARGEEQSFPADIWALGCTIFEMATGSPPWMDANDPVSALYRIAFSRKLPEIPTSLSEQLQDFLVRCLVRDPKQRWSTAQLLEHPFLENLKKIQNSLSNSPTSILDDEGFWSSMEESETPRNLTHIGCSSSASARLGRIRSLGAPNWGSEDDWITIRGNDTVETSGSDRFLTSNEVEEQFSICEMDLLDVKISSITSKNNSCSTQLCEFVNLNCEVNRVSTL